jgi:hypothetical protein
VPVFVGSMGYRCVLRPSSDFTWMLGYGRKEGDLYDIQGIFMGCTWDINGDITNQLDINDITDLTNPLGINWISGS